MGGEVDVGIGWLLVRLFVSRGCDCGERANAMAHSYPSDIKLLWRGTGFACSMVCWVELALVRLLRLD